MSEQNLITLDKNNSHISTNLLSLFREYASYTGTEPGRFESGLIQLNHNSTSVLVKITAQDVEGLVPFLEDIGFRVTGKASGHHFLEGFIPIASIEELESLAPQGLMGVVSVPRHITRVGIVTSQADVIHEANRVRTSLPTGFDGTGVRIGVMSNSFNVSGFGSAQKDIASGDLPAEGVTVLREGSPRGSVDEGRAMLQLIHDLAPGASLVFASVVGFLPEGDSPDVDLLIEREIASELGFAQQIRNLANPNIGNATILVDDIGLFTEPIFQDGVIAQAIDEVATTYGVAYFSAAGNDARESYESANFAGVQDSAGIFAGTFHDFDPGPGVDTRQLITLNPGIHTFLFQWDDPFFTTKGVDTDLDIFLVEPGTDNRLGDITTSNNIINQLPVELILFDFDFNPVEVEVMIQLSNGLEPGLIKYIHTGNGITFNEFGTNSSTIFGHPAAVNAIAVGAVEYFAQDNSNSFSSAGPTTILFDPCGNRLAEPEIRYKPEFAAVQNTDNTFFPGNIPLAQADIDGTGFPNFAGTSAAAPHAAAIAALIKQANPDFTPAQIYERLVSTAKDIDEPGRDDLTGSGLINAYDAVFGSVIPATLGCFGFTNETLFDGTPIDGFAFDNISITYGSILI